MHFALRNREKRRVLLFAAAVALLAGLIVFIKLRPQPVRLMPPESPEEAALREPPPGFALEPAEPLEAPESSDAELPGYKNGFYVLLKAVESLPDRPPLDTSYVPADQHPVESMLGLRNQEVSDIGRYLEQCDPAIGLALLALESEYFRYPPDGTQVDALQLEVIARKTLGPGFTFGTAYFPLLLTAKALYAAQEKGEYETALRSLTNAILVARLGLSDGSLGEAAEFSRAITRLRAWRRFADVADKVDSTAALLTAQQQVEATMENPFKATLAYTSQLRYYSNSLENPSHGASFGWGSSSDARIVLRDLGFEEAYDYYAEVRGARQANKVRRYLRENKERLLEALTYPWPEFVRWLAVQEQPEGVLTTLISHVEYFKRVETEWADALQRVVLVLALERYERDFGRYPERLGDLSPEFVAESLADPFTGRPYAYHVEGEGYVIEESES